ncbi:hypothetical protein BKA61DRAFT_621914 [Leptodontidium sp. MPI-SDFR-AT-0119]|nr:hypothetical protein BKA61DRAFT_621914 [Leptodontidium sp. MPI-SDFR-AT-0119]
MSVQFQFIPVEDKGSAAQKRLIRSHAAAQHNLRRKEQQRQKALQSLPTLNSLCTCDFSPSSLPWAGSWTSVQDSPRAQKISRVEEKRQRLADSYKICVRCKKLQFNELSRASQVAVMRMMSPHIAAFCQAEFDPFGILPESPWHLNPGEMNELHEVKYFIVTFYAPGSIRKFIIPEAIADPGLYMAMVFCGYAYLYGRRGLPMSNAAVAIKLETIRQINKKLQDPQQASAASTIASIAYLATAVRNFGGDTAAEEVAAHEAGVDELVKLRDGKLASLNQTPFDMALHGILVMHHVVYAGLSATQVSPTFDLKLPASPSPPLNDSEYLPESPFYRPRSSFFSLQESKRCSRATLEILYDMENIFTRLLERSWNGVLTEDLYQAQLLETSSRISKLESTSKTLDTSSTSRVDYYYDACRICALITLDAMLNSRALRHAPPFLVGQLIETLKETDIGNAWGDMLGVLYWITITGTAACPNNPGHQFMDSTFGKAQFDLCYTTKRLEARIKPAQRFAAIHQAIVDGPDIRRREKVLPYFQGARYG